jgi:methyl-CpG-binding domain protein 4
LSSQLPFSVGSGDNGAPVQEFGCSRCRYAREGCLKCRNPTFRPRTLAPTSELRAAVTEQRRQAERHKQALRKEQRKQEQLKTSSTARETLLQRLRTQLGPKDVTGERKKEKEITQKGKPMVSPEAQSQRPSKKSARSAGAAELHTPIEQPPAKYRRITREAARINNVGGVSLPQIEIQDEEMLDVAVLEEHEEEKEKETTPKKKNPKRPFLELLTDTMDRNRHARRASLEGDSINGGLLNRKGEKTPTSPLAELIDGPAIKRRKKAAELEKLSPTKGDGVIKNPRIATWQPPVSPYGLLEEELYDNPWKLLVACLLLNKTSGTQVRNVIWDLFKLIPTPEAAAAIDDTSQIEKIIHPLGLFRKRAVAVKKMSVDYLHKQWRDPKELFNLGQYASDAYFIFCRGMWRDVYPEDKDLKRYRDWLESTGGLGSGLTR